MKRAGFSFGEREYDHFVKRIDNSSRGKISPLDFKYFLFPHGIAISPPQQYNSNHGQDLLKANLSAEVVSLSPIKNQFASPERSYLSNEVQVPGFGTSNKRSNVAEFDIDENIEQRDRDVERSPDIMIPASQSRRAQSPQETQKDFYSPKKEQRWATATPNRTGMSGTGTGAGTGKEQIRIEGKNINQSNVSYQTNPLEQRHLDPTYNSYWNTQREHNKTLSPENFKKAGDYIAYSQSRLRGKQTRSAGNPYQYYSQHNTQYYNPGYLESGVYDNNERYSENPFRFTDHEHYFRNYYASLRNDYYDKYYNYTPYREKLMQSGNASYLEPNNVIPNELTGSHREPHVSIRKAYETFNTNTVTNEIPMFSAKKSVTPMEKEPVSQLDQFRISYKEGQEETHYEYISVKDPKLKSNGRDSNVRRTSGAIRIN
jgi:hypothetical protein